MGLPCMLSNRMVCAVQEQSCCPMKATSNHLGCPSQEKMQAAGRQGKDKKARQCKNSPRKQTADFQRCFTQQIASMAQ
eukprot:1137512-Pelagomonas_calceolata.AAC.8